MNGILRGTKFFLEKSDPPTSTINCHEENKTLRGNIRVRCQSAVQETESAAGPRKANRIAKLHSWPRKRNPYSKSEQDEIRLTTTYR